MYNDYASAIFQERDLPTWYVNPSFWAFSICRQPPASFILRNSRRASKCFKYVAPQPYDMYQNFFPSATCSDFVWLVVWNIWIIFPFSWECHIPNWRSPSFFSGVGGSTTNQRGIEISYSMVYEYYMNIIWYISQYMVSIKNHIIHHYTISIIVHHIIMYGDGPHRDDHLFTSWCSPGHQGFDTESLRGLPPPCHSHWATRPLGRLD